MVAPKLGLLDTLRFHLGVTTPALLWGLVAPNRLLVPLLSRLNAGRCVARTLNALREKRGDRFWVPFGLGAVTLVALDPDSMHELLHSTQSQSDPKLKKKALSKFIPEALTISADPEWKDRRAFNEHVLDTGHVHRYGDPFKEIAYAEVGRLSKSSAFELRWPEFQMLALRISQQVILGSGVLEPGLAQQVARMITRCNWPFLPENRSAFDDFYERLGKHLERHRAAFAAPNPCLMHDSSVSLVRNHTSNVTRVPRQIAFWVFVLKDALELHVSRTLALIAAHPEVQERVRQEVRASQPMTPQQIDGLHLLDACVREQLRLWTPVPMLGHRAVQQFTLNGVRIEPGQEVLIFTGRYHRDPQVFGDIADRFSPDTDADGSPPIYIFSQGRQACAGQNLARFMIKSTLAALLAKCRVDLIGPRVDPARIPYLYNHFKIKLRMTPDT